MCMRRDAFMHACDRLLYDKDERRGSTGRPEDIMAIGFTVEETTAAAAAVNWRV